MNRQYKTLFFDLDDTLLDYTGDEKRCIKSVLESYGQKVTEDIYDLYFSIDDWQLFQMGNLNAKSIVTDHFVRLLDMLEMQSKAKEMGQKFYDCMLHSHRIKVGARDVLQYLREKDYKMYITSNGFSDMERIRLKDAGMEQYFDGIFISEEIDQRKPGKSYFDYVCHRIPYSNHSQILLIGDAPTTDVLSGLNAGIDTCWFDHLGKSCKYKYTYKISHLKDLKTIL